MPSSCAKKYGFLLLKKGSDGPRLLEMPPRSCLNGSRRCFESIQWCHGIGSLIKDTDDIVYYADIHSLRCFVSDIHTWTRENQGKGKGTYPSRPKNARNEPHFHMSYACRMLRASLLHVVVPKAMVTRSPPYLRSNIPLQSTCDSPNGFKWPWCGKTC